MHSFGQTFAHSSQPMHLYQSIECWPRYAFGSSTRSYGYRTVTGFRRNVATIACFIVTRSGRMLPPRTPTLPPSADLGDLKGVLSLLHVHQSALPRAHEPALLRPDPPRLLRLDLLAQLEEPVDERRRPQGAARDEDVRRDERVRPLHDRVRVVVRPAADRALPHRDHPLRLRHLLVQPPDRGPQLEGDRPVQEQDVALAGARPVDDPEPFRVVTRVARRGHLDRAAHDPEVEGPRGVPLRPVEEVAHDGVQELPDRTLLQRRVNVPVHPLDEVLGLQADDVRLLGRLDHRSILPRGPATRGCRKWGRYFRLPIRFRAGLHGNHPAGGH